MSFQESNSITLGRSGGHLLLSRATWKARLLGGWRPFRMWGLPYASCAGAVPFPRSCDQGWSWCPWGPQTVLLRGKDSTLWATPASLTPCGQHLHKWTAVGKEIRGCPSCHLPTTTLGRRSHLLLLRETPEPLHWELFTSLPSYSRGLPTCLPGCPRGAAPVLFLLCLCLLRWHAYMLRFLNKESLSNFAFSLFSSLFSWVLQECLWSSALFPFLAFIPPSGGEGHRGSPSQTVTRPASLMSGLVLDSCSTALAAVNQAFTDESPTDVCSQICPGSPRHVCLLSTLSASHCRMFGSRLPFLVLLPPSSLLLVWSYLVWQVVPPSTHLSLCSKNQSGLKSKFLKGVEKLKKL